MIHVIVGDGKGKTSAAVGMAIRAAGHGWNVLFAQFIKDSNSGEVTILKHIPGITVLHSPLHYGFTFYMTDEQKKESTVEYEKMINYIVCSDVNMVILDEIIHALNTSLVERGCLEMLLQKNCEIVLTGQNAPDWLIEKADYVSDIRKIKHPYDKGIKARIGVEC